MLRVKFGGTYLADKDVSGLNGFTRTLIYESDRKVFRLKTETKLELIGNAFTFVYGEINKANCTKFDLIVEDDCSGNFESIFNGIVYSSDIFLDPNKCRATIETIKDNSYSAVIDALQDNNLNLYNRYSPNCNPINVNQYLVSYFDETATYIYSNRKSYKWSEVLNYLVSYFSNGSIDFQTNVTEEIWVSNGYNLRAQTGRNDLEYFEVNFFELFDNLSKLLNLAIVIEFDAFNKPILKVVYKSYLTNGGLIKTLTDDDVSFDFAISIDKSRQYNSVIVGSDNYQLNDEFYNIWNDENPMQTWQKRELNTCSSCLTERGNNLDLVVSYIIDSDLILDTLGGSDSNDENVFLIEGIYSTLSAKIYSIPYAIVHYNRLFINENVINRYSNEINCYTKDSLAGDGVFIARGLESKVFLNTQGTGMIGTARDLNYISSGEYNSIKDNGTNAIDTSITGGDAGFTYVIPTNGNYQFQFKGTYGLIQFNSIDVRIRLGIRVYAGGTLPYVGVSNHIHEEFIENLDYDYSDGQIPFFISLTKDLNVGDLVVCFVFAELDYNFPNPNGIIFQIGVKDYEFNYIGCATEDTTTQSSNDLPFLANFSFLQTQNEFNELVKTNKRYGYFRYKGSRLFISSIENNGCKSNGIFYCDKLPECT